MCKLSYCNGCFNGHASRMCSTYKAPTKCQDYVDVLDECPLCGGKMSDNTYSQERSINGVEKMSSSDKDVPTFFARVSAEHEVAEENRRHCSNFLQKLLDDYEGGGGLDFSLDLLDDDDDSKAPS
jgi:hypothetical protein